MFLAFYNKKHVGDILLLTAKETTEKIAFETKENVTRIFIIQNNETIAYNIQNISQILSLSTDGQQFLTQDDVQKINEVLLSLNFEPIEIDNTPKLVVGYVEDCQKHPDSDHLHITQVSVGEEKPLQIVCGASNVAEGQLVVVAKVGNVMPNGQIIYAGELRGIRSDGMLCSARELNMSSDMKKGILVLDSGEVGSEFITTHV